MNSVNRTTVTDLELLLLILEQHFILRKGGKGNEPRTSSFLPFYCFAHIYRPWAFKFCLLITYYFIDLIKEQGSEENECGEERP